MNDTLKELTTQKDAMEKEIETLRKEVSTLDETGSL